VADGIFVVVVIIVGFIDGVSVSFVAIDVVVVVVDNVVVVVVTVVGVSSKGFTS